MSNRQSHYVIDRGFSSLSKRSRMAGTMSEVVKINELARARNMSYGQFVSEGQAMLNKIRFPEWVKASTKYTRMLTKHINNLFVWSE